MHPPHLSHSIFLFVLTVGYAVSPLPAQSWSVDSPDIRLRLTLHLAEGTAAYEVAYQQTPPAWDVKASGFRRVVDRSPMGVLTDQADFTRGLRLLEASAADSRSEPYVMLTGKGRLLDNHFGERVVSLQSAAGHQVDIRMRAYAEGVAFRYEFPGKDAICTVKDEITGFHLGATGRAWMMPYSAVDTWAPGYEEDWQVGIPIGKSAPVPVGWALPALFQTDQAWILLTESGMDGNYFASHLQPDATGGLYRLRLPETDETYGVHPRESRAAFPFRTPWRVIMVAASPAGILENSLVHHLADPCRIADTSWIRPGPSTWSWLFDKNSQTDLLRLKPFITLSAELGWPYSLVDADWHLMRNGDIEEAVQFAAAAGVGLNVWYNSGGPHNLVKPIGPADRMHDPELRRREMAWLQQAGIKGIKVDFMQSDKQGILRLYEDILRDAAEFRLLVIFHGCTMPRGWERTWPNLMAMEAVKGGEQLWSQDFANRVPVHNTVLPFTRNVVGSMDYTPFTFRGVENGVTTVTTRGHELATTVVFESGIQHVSEMVENFEALPHYVWRFLQNLETAWDRTVHLDGSPGEHVVLARRKGDSWYVAGISAHAANRTLRFATSFLDARPYHIELVSDGDNPTSFRRRQFTVRPGDTIEVEVLAHGGFVATLKPL